jgi:hypothetical protein
MEIFGFVLLGCVCIYLIWKVTKAVLTAVFFTIALGVALYLAAPYVLTGEHLDEFNRVRTNGEELLEDQLNKAKDITEDGLVKPLQNTLVVPQKDDAK